MSERYRTTPETQSAARLRAWRTRRAKYGVRGHGSSYSRHGGPCEACKRMESVIVRLHIEGILSEGQAAKAIGVGRVVLRALADQMGGATL